ncbi:fam-a protein [Plasmodium vinckei]|uniref:Fam-a protein n=1 Tax=Plasmodium vinckei TaxID=5860 RepID=A0A6V7SBL0_PLAVN|nr:fam-a protein [Plasmodium vinckei]
MNKFYIQVVFFLLSVSVYLNNKTLATEPASEENTETKTKIESKKTYSTPEEIFEENKHLLCTNPEEKKQAEELMNEAATQLEYHIKNGDYKLHKRNKYYNITLLKKEHEDAIVHRISLKYYHINKYNEITNIFWDPALANDFNNGSAIRKIVRVYNPNLVIIQQCYKKLTIDSWKYFYALAAKFDISEEKTIIVMTTPNINDGHPSEKKYKNTIIESANSFKFDIDSEDDIRNGKLNKTFVNILGYLIEKKGNGVRITYLESIDGHTSNSQKLILDKALNKFFNYEDDKLYVYP